jgi:hypothetical protein
VDLLHSGANRAKYDREVQSSGLSPFVSLFITQGLKLSCVKIFKGLEVVWVLRDKSTFPKQRRKIHQSLFLGKSIDVLE